MPARSEWYRDWRAAHQDESGGSSRDPLQAVVEPALMVEVPGGSSSRFGPTASSEGAVEAALRERLGGEVVFGDSAALFAGSRRIAGGAPSSARPRRNAFDHDVSVGRVPAAGARRSTRSWPASVTAIVAGGTGLYLRAALSSVHAARRRLRPAHAYSGELPR